MCGRALNDAAAKYDVAVVENSGLSRRDGTLRPVKVNPCPIVGEWCDSGVLFRLAVARFDLAADGRVRRFAGNPVAFGNTCRAAEQILCTAERDGIALRTDGADIALFRQIEAESAVLTDGVADDSAVEAEDSAIR